MTRHISCTMNFGNMARNTHCKEFEKGRIFGMLEAGLSVSEEARRVNRGKAMAHLWWQKYRTIGRFERFRGSGRQKI